MKGRRFSYRSSSDAKVISPGRIFEEITELLTNGIKLCGGENEDERQFVDVRSVLRERAARRNNELEDFRSSANLEASIKDVLDTEDPV